MTEGYNFGDLAKQASIGMQPVPVGDYDCIVHSAEPSQSGNGKLMFKTVLKIVGGPQNGRTLYNNVTLTQDNPNALVMFFSNMKAMGLTAEFFAQNPTPQQIADALVTHPVHVKIDHREYPKGSGNMRENIKSMSPPAGVSPSGAMAPASVPAPGAAPAPAGVPAPMPAAAPTPPAIPQPQNPAPPEPTAQQVVEQIPAEAASAPEVQAATPEQIPAGYEAVWDTLPQAAKDAILAQQNTAQAQPAAPAPEPQATPQAPAAGTPAVPPPSPF